MINKMFIELFFVCEFTEVMEWVNMRRSKFFSSFIRQHVVRLSVAFGLCALGTGAAYAMQHPAMSSVNTLEAIGNATPTAAMALVGVQQSSVLPHQPNTTVEALALATAPARTGSDSKGVSSQSKADALLRLSQTLRQLQAEITELEADAETNADTIEALKASKQVIEAKILSHSKQLDVLGDKIEQQDKRLTALEQVQIHGDLSVGSIADMSRGSRGDKTGINDAISTVGRLRLTIDAPVLQPSEDSKLGVGAVSARIIGAYGRYGPIGNASGGQTGSAYGSNYGYNAYSRIGADISAFNEGFGTGATGTLNKQTGDTSYTRPNLFIEAAFYKQNFKAGIPLLTALPTKTHLADKEGFNTSADLMAGLVRWWDVFDVSPYRGDEMSQFQNIAFANTPGIVVNYAQPMITYQLHQGLGKHLNADFTGGIGSMDVGDAMNGFNATYEGKLSYLPAFLPSRYQKPGSVYVGGYSVTMSGNRNLTQVVGANYKNRAGNALDLTGQQSVQALYAGWNQEWWRGIGTSVGVLMNNDSPSVAVLTSQQPGPAGLGIGAKRAMNAVVQVPTTALGWHKRTKDTFGVGMALVDIYDNSADTSVERVGEVYYNLRLTDAFSIIPSAQVIVNPAGANKHTPITVLGCRMSYKF